MIDRERFWIGDHEYFAEIIRDYGRIVTAVCRSFGETEDEEEDLIQGVWMLVYEKRRSFRGKGTFAGWLHRIAKNHCTDVYRTRKAERKGMEIFVARGGANDLHGRPRNPGEALEKRDNERALQTALDALPEKEREAIILRFLQCRSPAEVAKVMEIGKASVRSNISRGVKRLRGIIGGGEK